MTFVIHLTIFTKLVHEAFFIGFCKKKEKENMLKRYRYLVVDFVSDCCLPFDLQDSTFVEFIKASAVLYFVSVSGN